MKTFPKDILDSMRSCILAIFWPRKDIIDFFSNNGCTKRDIGKVIDFKGKHLSRADIVDLVFESLSKREGLGPFRSMLQSLIEWNHFDPYFFNKLKKLDEDEAKRRITHLRQLQEIRDAKIEKKRKIRENRKKQLEVNKVDRTLLKRRFISLFQGKDINGKSINPQKRGILFESFLKDLFHREDVDVTESFKIIGEQIDGAIKYDGENYLVEAKWHDSFIASSALYHFAQKVEGKMYGRGIFISINGYSSESIKALVAGKALRTILLDGNDIILVVEGLYTFKDMLDKKIKAAQTMGKIYVDVNNMKEKIY